MYKNIIEFVESKLEGFIKPEIIFEEEFTYGIETRNISVPNDYTCSPETVAWWERFMLQYLLVEHGLSLSKKDVYTFSLLHEIGHYITLEGIPSDIVYQKYIDEERKIPYHLSSSEFNKRYREISIERMADLWAIDFIETYPEVLDLNNQNIY